MTTATQEIPRWDLSDYYSGIDDPNIDSDLKGFFESAEKFEDSYKGTIAVEELTASHLAKVLTEFSELAMAQYKLSAYSQLLYSTKTEEASVGALLQKVSEAGSALAKHFVFLELEIGKIPESTYSKIILDSELAKYTHYLEHQRDLAQHQLTEAEEKILIETSNVRGSAFARLFSEVTTRVRFDSVGAEQGADISASELLSYLFDPDREVRKACADSYSKGLKSTSHVCTYIYNTLLHEKDILDRLRNFEYPEASRNKRNELSQSDVQTMTDVCVKNYDIVADYYELKAQLLGLDKLYDHDRYAPILDQSEEIPFDEAKAIVMDAFNRFSPKLAELTDDFFSKNWIDAAPYEGKQSGAFCSLGTPKHHPFVFMNYMGKSRDVMTLAHELGHGIHAVLGQRNHYLDFDPVLPLAETASTFAEALVFDLLMERLDDPKEKLALLCGKIEDSFATIYRQIAMYRFEQGAHRARRSEGEISSERYNEIFQTSLQEMFGDSLELQKDHGFWWMHIPHFFQVPFYVYAYAFGELLVFSLYALYQSGSEGFEEKYFELLALGGSMSPADLVSTMGFDISDASFWQAGCDLVRARVDQAKALAQEI